MSTGKEVIGGQVEFGGQVLPLSMAVRAGDFVFVSGMVACDANGVPKLDGDIDEQTRLAVRAIESQLVAAGCGLQDIVRAMVFLKNPEDFPAFNGAYAEFFSEQPPTRTTVTSGFMADPVLVEIEVTAYNPDH